MQNTTVKRTKQIIKKCLKGTRRKYIRWRHAFDDGDFLAFLQEIGIKEGDVVLVHSSYKAFEGYTGYPVNIISVLQECVGSSGTILMPTMPFDGTALKFVRRGKPLNVDRTPSRMGLLTELFRRMSNVVRSVHPTHPVAAWGKFAEDIIAGHSQCGTPCGRDSPFGKLLDFNGRILFLGTGIGVLTFLHTAEEIMEDELPYPVFTDEIFHLTTIASDGAEVTTHTRLFDPAVSRKRDPYKLIPELKKQGKWTQRRLGCLDAILLDASDILEVLQKMAEKGEYCYSSSD